MSSQGVNILRLILAAVNGVMFAVGVYLILENLRFRPARWKKRIRELIREAEREELAAADENDNDEYASKKRAEIDSLKRLIEIHKRDPRAMIPALFGGLLVTVSIFALFNLIFPVFSPFR